MGNKKEINAQAAANAVMVKLAGIKPYYDNPKLHDAEQIAKLCDQIKLAGFDQPIVVDKDMVIIKGHGRFLAATKLCLDEVPVVINSKLTSEQAMAVRIADNRVAETGWDNEKLRSELATLQEADFDLALTAFDEDELDALLKGTNTPPDTGDEGGTGASGKMHTCPECGHEFED